MSVSAALEVYRSFQAKEPDIVTALDERIGFPKRLGSVGQVKRLLYRSSKWRKDGKEHDYVHVYSTPVELCEPYRDGLQPIRSPKWSRELVHLGTCLDVEVMAKGGKMIYPSLPSGTLLCGTPDGRSLVLLHLRRGILAALIGSAQRITDRGVEG